MANGNAIRRRLGRKLVLAGIAAMAAAGLGQVFDSALAQSYPTRVIKMIVPFAPGGQPDAIARLIAQHLSQSVGTTIIDNRPGANGLLAVRAATGSEADGHTLMFGSVTTLAILPVLSRSADFDPVKSFVPIGTISTAPFILAVGPSVPAKTVGEFIAYAKANPGKLNFAAPTGSPPHLGGEMFKRATGVDIVPVSYRALSQAFTDLIGGQMDIIFDAPALLLPLIREGKIRALVAMSATRTPDLPDVPTMAESGLGDVQVTVWNGLVAPAGTPAPIVGRLNAALNEGLRSAPIKSTLANFGSQPLIGSPQDFSAFMASEAKKWADIVRASGVKID
jgi:tripartite-type tricarboxylate transporter receptor subunit TctC